MSYEIGTAINYSDLLDKFYVFITTNAELVSNNQQWTAVRWTSDAVSKEKELILKGVGLSQSDEIYCGIRSYEDSSLDYYIWDFNGFIGYSDSKDFYNQPGAISGRVPRISLHNSLIQYWFIANGRRIIIIAKFGTIYQAAYLGFIKSYMSPVQYPYPLFIGGSMTGVDGLKYDVVSDDHRHFVNPGSTIRNAANTSCMLRNINGSWMPFQNYYNNNIGDYPGKVWPYCVDRLKYIRESVSNNYTLFPIVLSQYNSSGDHNLFGELDGCYNISGFNNSSGNNLNLDTSSGVKTGLVVQNVYRSSIVDYWGVFLDDVS